MNNIENEVEQVSVTQSHELGRLLVYHKNYLVSITHTEIAVCMLHNRSIRIITTSDQVFTTPRSLNEIETKLGNRDFFRINRNCIIAYKSISHIEPYFGNRLVILLRNKVLNKVIVSRPRVQAFKIWLGE